MRQRSFISLTGRPISRDDYVLERISELVRERDWCLDALWEAKNWLVEAEAEIGRLRGEVARLRRAEDGRPVIYDASVT